MPQAQHLEAFVNLGRLFTKFCENPNDIHFDWLAELKNAIEQAEINNAWYTKDNITFCLRHWGNVLQEKSLTDWISPYGHSTKQKTIAIIMAGNIPLVGFHDFLCVLLSENRVLAKLSSNDRVLLPFIKDFLVKQDKSLEDKIAFTEEKLTDFDAVIATGSNNTSRYFEYYFGKYPSIIRKNRNSVAVLTGRETPQQLEALGEDIFRYFGLGCRSVSKVFVPKGYDFDNFFKAIYGWKHVLDHHKYVNNYDYNKAVYLMSEIKILDNGFLIVKEDANYASPIATLFFEYYDNLAHLKERLSNDSESIQCVVSEGFIEGEVPFGKTQSPLLSDYADGVDTMQFLTALK